MKLKSHFRMRHIYKLYNKKHIFHIYIIYTDLFVKLI